MLTFYTIRAIPKKLLKHHFPETAKKQPQERKRSGQVVNLMGLDWNSFIT